MSSLPALITTQKLAARLGLSKSGVHWRLRHSHLPQPVGTLGRGREFVWSSADLTPQPPIPFRPGGTDETCEP